MGASNMDLTPKQQTSEAIRQAETILVATGQHPTVDQAAAVIALTAILRKFGKKANGVISDNLPQAINLLDTAMIERNLGGLRDFILKVDVTKAEVEKLRYEVLDGKLNIFLTPYKGSFAPSDVTFGFGESQVGEYDLIVILGVPTRARIDRVLDQSSGLFERTPVLNLDFHRSNEGYGAVNLIEPNASSLCEMLVALSESLQSGIVDAEIATALLMGIVGSTDRFTAAHTTSKSLTVAAQMMAAGARQQAVVRALYREGRDGARGNNASDQGRDGGARGERSSGGERGNRRENQRDGQRSGERNTASDRAAGGERMPERTVAADRTGGERGMVTDRAQMSERPAAGERLATGTSVEVPRAASRPAASAPSSEVQASMVAPTPVQPEVTPLARPVVEDAPVVQAVTQAVTPLTAPMVAPELVRQSQAGVMASSPAPQVAQTTPTQEDGPIIQPGHIEMSTGPEASVAPFVPAQAAPAASPQSATDFAAAAEVVPPRTDQNGQV